MVGSYCFLISLFQFDFTRTKIENIIYTLSAAAMVESAIGVTQTLGWHVSSSILRAPFGVPISFLQQIGVHVSFLVSDFLIAGYLITTPTIKHRPLSYKLIILLTIAATMTVLLAIGYKITLSVFMVSASLILALGLQKLKQHMPFTKALCLTFLISLGFSGNPSNSLQSTGQNSMRSKLMHVFIYTIYPGKSLNKNHRW